MKHRTASTGAAQVVTLNDADARELTTTYQAVERTRMAFEAGVARLKADGIEAQMAHTALLNRLGPTYGFDPSDKFTFDCLKRTLTKQEPEPEP